MSRAGSSRRLKVRFNIVVQTAPPPPTSGALSHTLLQIGLTTPAA